MRLQVCDRASVIPYFPHTQTPEKMNGLIATIWYGVHAPDKIIFQLMIYVARTRWQFRRPTELSPPGGTNFPSDGSTVGGEVRKCEHDVNKIIETIKNSTLTTLTRLVVCNPFTQSRAAKKIKKKLHTFGSVAK